MIPSSNHLGLLMICLDVTLLFLGVVALGIRLKSRYILKQRLGLNDYSALLAWVWSLLLLDAVGQVMTL